MAIDSTLQYLSSQEMQYQLAEQQILTALRYLAHNCDYATSKDSAGFSRVDGDFGRDLARKGIPFSARQLLAAFRLVRKYERTQLASAGIFLPPEEAVQAVARSKEVAYTARKQQYDDAPTQPQSTNQARIIGLRDGMIGVMFPNRSSDFQSNLDKIHEIQREVEGLRLVNPTLDCVAFVEAPSNKSGMPIKYWQVPVEFAEAVVSAFPTFHILPEVVEIVNAAQERRRAEQERLDEIARKERERIARLMAAVGDLDAPIGDRTLFEHQREAIETMLRWGSGVLAYDMGLGKTFIGAMIAKAYMHSEGCRVIVVGPKTLRANWVREAGWVGVPIEYFTHDSIPTDIPEKFVLICDESQAYQNRQSKRTKKFLELAWKAEAVFCATGTPSKNGRPSNIYPLLLAVKHPLVYVEKGDRSPAHDQIKKLRRTFESRYCAAQPTEYSPWDITGAAYLKELHHKIVDSPRGVLRRRKDQCLDLPDKIRKLVPVELTAAEIETYQAELSEMWNEYQRRVEEKIEEFKEKKLPAKVYQEVATWLQETLTQEQFQSSPDPRTLVPAEDLAALIEEATIRFIAIERARVESGQALVMLGHLRHAGSRAKARATIDLISDLFDEDEAEVLEAEREGRPHKPAAVIVFCAYKDTAEQIAEHFGVYVMSGDTPEKQRQPMVDAFQAGENRVFVGIYGAGGVGVTLTAANTVILVDRPWTPGDAEQAEDRAHRISQDQAVICQWLQVPQFINPIDAKIDGILQRKQENVVKMLDGGTGNYDPDLLFSNMAVGLLHEATHFQAGTESEVER